MDITTLHPRLAGILDDSYLLVKRVTNSFDGKVMRHYNFALKQWLSE